MRLNLTDKGASHCKYQKPQMKTNKTKNLPSSSVVSAFIEWQDAVLAQEFTSSLFSSMGNLKAWVDKTLYNLLYSAATLWKQLGGHRKSELNLEGGVSQV